MKKVYLRGCPLAYLLLCVFFSGTIVGFCLFSLKVISEPTIPMIARIICAPLILVLLFPLAVRLFWDGICTFSTRVVFYESYLTYQRPFAKRLTVSFTDISVFGCISYKPLGNMLFLSTVPVSEMKEYLEQNWNTCIHIFNAKTVSELKRTEEGWNHLAISTFLSQYVHCRNNQVLIIPFGSMKRLENLVKLLKRDAIITGPILIPHLSQLKQHAKYYPQNR